MRYLVALLTLILLGAFAWRPVGAQHALGPGIYNDDFFLLDYIPDVGSAGGSSWIYATGFAGHYNEDRTRTTLDGDAVEFNIWGDGVTIWLLTCTTCSDPQVCIDSNCVTVSLVAGSNLVVAFDFISLGYGTHEITITNVVVSGRNFLALDAVLVHPPAPQPTLPPQEIEILVTIVPEDLEFRDKWQINAPSGEQTVAFDYHLDAGDLLNGILLGGSFFVLLIIVGLKLFTGRGSPDG